MAPSARRSAISSTVRPSSLIRREPVVPVAGVLKFMREEYVPRARETLAAESLPGGKAYYQSKIVEFTTTALTAGQIHQIGLSEMAKIRAEMQVVDVPQTEEALDGRSPPRRRRQPHRRLFATARLPCHGACRRPAPARVG